VQTLLPETEIRHQGQVQLRPHCDCICALAKCNILKTGQISSNRKLALTDGSAVNKLSSVTSYGCN
jgi:hypothetical protein